MYVPAPTPLVAKSTDTAPVVELCVILPVLFEVNDVTPVLLIVMVEPETVVDTAVPP